MSWVKRDNISERDPLKGSSTTRPVVTAERTTLKREKNGDRSVRSLERIKTTKGKNNTPKLCFTRTHRTPRPALRAYRSYKADWREYKNSPAGRKLICTLTLSASIFAGVKSKITVPKKRSRGFILLHTNPPMEKVAHPNSRISNRMLTTL